MLELNVTLEPNEILLDSTVGDSVTIIQQIFTSILIINVIFRYDLINELKEIFPITMAKSLHCLQTGIVTVTSLIHELNLLLEIFREFQDSVDLERLLDIIFAFVRELATCININLADVAHD